MPHDEIVVGLPLKLNLIDGAPYEFLGNQARDGTGKDRLNPPARSDRSFFFPSRHLHVGSDQLAILV